jgi:hypothetical protein
MRKSREMIVTRQVAQVATQFKETEAEAAMPAFSATEVEQLEGKVGAEASGRASLGATLLR